jgi:ribosomal protein S3
VIGVKVWIFKGEIIGDKAGQTETTEKQSAKQEK